MRTLYLECNSGISGDMTVAALLDLGADEAALKDGLASLRVDGYLLKISRVKKAGIDACDFDVILESGGPKHGDFDHDHDNQLENGHTHKHTHDHGHEHSHSHDHIHEHKHGHEHGHEHGHSHDHIHRNLCDILAIIDGSGITPKAKDMARRIFETVARAEAKVHGLPVEQVHFHEVGAVDSIVDIIGAAICIDSLGVNRIICSPLKEGTGTVKCRHGVMPVPAPATMEIIREKGIPLEITDNIGEMVTPTGAAIVGALADSFGRPERMTVKAIGYGAGKKDFQTANLLRAVLIEEACGTGSDVVLLECNLDDMTGEHLGYAAEKLLEAGALDVWCTPAAMKKSRPGQVLSVLARPNQEQDMTALLFTHTSTIGIRRSRLQRHVMDRSFREAETPWGFVTLKECDWNGVKKMSVEYESARKISESCKIPIDLVYRSAYNR